MLWEAVAVCFSRSGLYLGRSLSVIAVMSCSFDADVEKKNAMFNEDCAKAGGREDVEIEAKG